MLHALLSAHVCPQLTKWPQIFHKRPPALSHQKLEKIDQPRTFLDLHLVICKVGNISLLQDKNHWFSWLVLCRLQLQQYPLRCYWSNPNTIMLWCVQFQRESNWCRIAPESTLYDWFIYAQVIWSVSVYNMCSEALYKLIVQTRSVILLFLRGWELQYPHSHPLPLCTVLKL